MIPIIYEKDETAFVSNGLGRLRDMISCVVTEERNGVYECDFEYPITGANYDRIQVGRIVGVTHDDSDDIQPFDIVSYSKPIDGVVTFHCQHISYRQSFLTVTGNNINSLANAFTLFKNSATPTNPFSYWTDKSSTGYLSSADGIPKTVRSMLGGIEGSVLDIYGGEYEWDKFTVKLHASRGETKDFAIRYGVNMLDYNEEYDISSTYSSCIPYWTDGTDKVIGDKQTTTGATITNRGECIPLDISDRFESKPTKAQVNSMGLSVLKSQNPTLPAQNISVSFVRLQDVGEFSQFSHLMECKLCDTINVIFPDFNSSGQFKIVKTVWDVLADRYDEMELGELSVSLSEALGISNQSERLNDGSFTKLHVEELQADQLEVTDSMYMDNSKIIYGKDTNGTDRSAIQVYNGSNNVVFGYGGYDGSIGNTNIYGNNINLTARSNINASQPLKVGGYKIITTQVFNADNISISANGYAEGSISITKTGYTPIGVLDTYVNNASSSGSGSSFAAIYRTYHSGNTYYYGLRNVTNSAIKVRVYAKILYVATSQGI